MPSRPEKPNRDEPGAPGTEDGPISGTKPLSRGASRAFVILSIILVLAASIGGAYWLIALAEANTALQQQAAPADTTEAPADPGR